MPKLDRLNGITINGEPVAEIDVRASHLSIMHGLLGLELPHGDPYEVPGLPRDVVKAWIVATLGLGKPAVSWRRKRPTAASPPGTAHPGAYHTEAVKDAVCARYPFLRAPAKAVADCAGLTKLSRFGKPEALLSLRLQAIEARALTTAMVLLQNWHEGPSGPVLALPLHDSLIVPRSAVAEADTLIQSAFAYWAGVRVRTTVQEAAAR
jgi:hypothetical protein